MIAWTVNSLGASAAPGVTALTMTIAMSAITTRLRLPPPRSATASRRDCSITTLRVLDDVRRLVRANEVGDVERRGH